MVVLASATLACADGTAPTGRRPFSVSFSAASVAATTAASGDVTPEGAVADAGAGEALAITKAQLVVARTELARAGAVCTSDEAAGDDDHADDDDCAELELAPSVVDLPVNGTVVDALTVTVPAGSYTALEAKVRPVHGNSGRGHGSAAFLSAHPDLEGVSVLVEGTINGSPFTFTSDVSTAVEQTFAPPLEVGDAPLNLTVHVDLANWFVSSAGGLIDPRTAAAGTENARLIAANIKRSFRVFHDDDHDGHDDHGDHDGDSGRH